MTDSEALAAVLGNQRKEMLLRTELYMMWMDRHNAWRDANGRTAACDCLFWQPGDMVAALERTHAIMTANGESI